MSTVSQLLRTKGSNVISIAPEASIYDALQLMAEKNIGAVLVVENEEMVGIFSERDYAYRQASRRY